ncbi:STAS-like domain-containing protein [Pseudovibrio sp. Alg231-02]|uniref:STAS-like domain-containing protein n=1 Tax=Pseudovibrio sp. Alg231-02 TaxID=1922223 RepID=UPI000D55C48B|nr:STAS-like domain-containing protein [Pseudovibrio sp. Alg231-02]
MKTISVPISVIVGGGICVSASDGHKVFDVIRQHIVNGNRAALSFSGVTRMTTAFLNAAVGQLYGDFDEQKIRQHLAPPEDAEDWHLVRLKIVVDRAKIYFNDNNSIDSIFSSITGQVNDKNS